ncbi:MAG: DMT family transporter [Clostridia bacterium]|nr:DMT family transporter [Clostridia bacterium]
MKQKNQRRTALLLLVLTATLWSLGGLLIKSVNAHPLAIAGTRSAISAVVIFLYVKKPKFTWSFAQIAAALSYALTVILFVAANKLTTAANAILIQYSAPLYVALMGAWLLKEKPKLIDWATIGVVMGGMVLFFIDKLDVSGIWGNILAALSGLTFGLFAVFMRMQKDGSPVESVLLGNIMTAIIGLPFLSVALPNTTGWLCLGILGVVQLGIPYILYSIAIKQATALEASLIPVIEPILNPIWVFLLLGETPGALALAGGIIVLIAVTVRCVVSATAKTSAEESQNEAVAS